MSFRFRTSFHFACSRAEIEAEHLVITTRSYFYISSMMMTMMMNEFVIND